MNKHLLQESALTHSKKFRHQSLIFFNTKHYWVYFTIIKMGGRGTLLGK